VIIDDDQVVEAGIISVAFVLVLLVKDPTELAPDANPPTSILTPTLTPKLKLKLDSLSLCEGVMLLFIVFLLSTLAQSGFLTWVGEAKFREIIVGGSLEGAKEKDSVTMVTLIHCPT
jgi:hypothetical protein